MKLIHILDPKLMDLMIDFSNEPNDGFLLQHCFSILSSPWTPFPLLFLVDPLHKH